MPDKVALTEDYILTTFREAMKSSTADQTEIVLEGEKLSLTRFAESKITQNLTTSDSKVIVRTIRSKQIGVAVSNSLRLEDIRNTIKAAQEISSIQSRDDAFQTLPSSPPAISVRGFYEATDQASPTARADAVSKIASLGAKDNLSASGAYRTTTDLAAVVNSLGTEQFFRGTKAELSLTLSDDSGRSGYAIGFDRDIGKIDPPGLAQRASEKALKSADPVELPGGPYTVILEPAAVGQMVLLLSFMGFGCKTYVTRRSFMAGNIGNRIAGQNVSLIEDPYNQRIQGMPFDYEGVPRQRVVLIENGIARNVVWNSYYAGMANEKSTGHAHPAYKTFSPYPKYLTMTAGANTVDEMITSTERGIYITHFWYVNYLNPMRTMVTGTTLDGTFLIENGQISKPIVNMRMAQSILEMLSNVQMISGERQLYPQYSVIMLLPYLKVDGFNLMPEGVEE